MKEKETWELKMTTNDDAPACARAGDLVSYLYGEADAAAARSFESHTQHCAACRTELAQFGHVRAAINDWRTQALGSTSPAVSVNAATVNVATARKPSALAALREFFSLSPLWMRTATAALGLVFCALVALAIAHYFEQPKTITVERISTVKPSEAELEAMVTARLRQRDAASAISPTEGTQPGPEITKASAPKAQPSTNVNRGSKRNVVSQQQFIAKSAPELSISPQESREIARDLRLVAATDEEDLPRLSDLIEESN